MILRSGLDMRGNEIKFAAGERVAALPESNLFAGRVVLLVTPGVAPAPDTGSYYFYNGSSWEPLHGIKELEDRVDDIEEVIPNTASTDNPLATIEDATYSDFSGSGTGHSGGLVPDPGATAGTSKYLREDGTWETPPNTTYSDMSGSGSGHAGGLVPDPGATAGTSKYLREDGTWETPPNTTYSDMGASGSGHASGLVPDPGATAGTSKYLREDGTWETPPDTKYSAMGASGSTHAPGLVPDTPSTSGTSKYLREDGTWETPPDTTYSDMVGSGSNHAGGLVPDPGATAGTSKYLREDGTWETPPNTTYSDMSGSGSGHTGGLVPDPGATAGTSKYLREDGTWETPPDTKYSTMGASGSTHAPGLVPDTPSSEGETKYLREDGTWQVPPDTKYSAMGASGSGHAPGLVPDTPSTSGTSKYLREDGTWEVPPNTTYSDMSGSGSGHAGGLVPDPGATAGTSKYLREDGTWETPPNTTYSAMGASGSGHAAGLVPDPGATAGTSKYLREDGTWAVPAGGGGTVERYVPKYAHREGNDVYFEAAVDEGASYTFDCGSYTWVGVQMKDAAGTNTRAEIGHLPSTTSVTFTAATGETQAVMRFFPGNDVTFEDIDWTKISYTKDGETAGECSGRNAADIERVSGSTILPPKQPTNIIDILEGATQANPVQITLMGDSITNGYSADSGKSWAALLEAYIEDRYPYVTVVNTGVSGWKSSDAVTNIATAMPSGTTVAIAMFGTNNRQTQEHMDALYSDYTTMYNYARNMGAKFIPMCCTAETLVNESITAKYVATMDDVERIISKWAVDHNMEMINLYEGLLKYCNYDSDAFDTLFNQTETTNVGGVTYPFHIHPTNDGHYIMYRLICEALGCNAPVAQYTAPVGGGGGGAPKYLHRIYLYRKGFCYLSFDLFTSSSTSFQGDTQDNFDALVAEFVNQNFTSFSWRSIPQVTGWYRETSDGEAIPICAIYCDSGTGHLVGVREGVSLSTLSNATIALTNIESFSSSPKGTIFDNNIQAIGGGSGGTVPEVTSTIFPCATGFTNFSGNSVIIKNGRIVTLSLILTVGGDYGSHSLLGNLPSEYRPSSVNVLPGVVAYEDSDRLPEGCTINVNSDGTVRYYGISLTQGRHICINGSYLVNE